MPDLEPLLLSLRDNILFLKDSLTERGDAQGKLIEGLADSQGKLADRLRTVELEQARESGAGSSRSSAWAAIATVVGILLSLVLGVLALVFR